MQPDDFAGNNFPILAKTDQSGFADCTGSNCPTIYQADDDDVLIQGYDANGLFLENALPKGERVVRIPRGLLRQLVANGEL